MALARKYLLAAGALVLTAATLGSAVAAAPAAGNAAIGAKLFLQCRACHVVGAQKSTIGPNLSGMVGAKAGSVAGYAYSASLAKSGIVWTPETLDKFLTKPTAVVPGTKMAFAGMANPKARADMIAYLATLKKAR